MGGSRKEEKNLGNQIDKRNGKQRNWAIVSTLKPNNYKINPKVSRRLVSAVLKDGVKKLSDPKPRYLGSSLSQIYALCPLFLRILAELIAKYKAFEVLAVKLTEPVTCV